MIKSEQKKKTTSEIYNTPFSLFIMLSYTVRLLQYPPPLHSNSTQLFFFFSLYLKKRRKRIMKGFYYLGLYSTRVGHVKPHPMLMALVLTAGITDTRFLLGLIPFSYSSFSYKQTQLLKCPHVTLTTNPAFPFFLYSSPIFLFTFHASTAQSNYQHPLINVIYHLKCHSSLSHTHTHHNTTQHNTQTKNASFLFIKWLTFKETIIMTSSSSFC